jgi:hypothetical protein
LGELAEEMISNRFNVLDRVISQTGFLANQNNIRIRRLGSKGYLKQGSL